MGIISILFLVFGWGFGIKGLVITSLVLSSLFAIFLTLWMFINPKADKYYDYENITNTIYQFTILILSIVKLVKGF